MADIPSHIHGTHWLTGHLGDHCEIIRYMSRFRNPFLPGLKYKAIIFLNIWQSGVPHALISEWVWVAVRRKGMLKLRGVNPVNFVWGKAWSIDIYVKFTYTKYFMSIIHLVIPLRASGGPYTCYFFPSTSFFCVTAPGVITDQLKCCNMVRILKFHEFYHNNAWDMIL